MQNQVALNKPSKKAKLVCVLINGDVAYDIRSHFPYHSHARSRQLDCKLRLGENQPSSAAPGRMLTGMERFSTMGMRYDTIP